MEPMKTPSSFPNCVTDSGNDRDYQKVWEPRNILTGSAYLVRIKDSTPEKRIGF